MYVNYLGFLVAVIADDGKYLWIRYQDSNVRIRKTDPELEMDGYKADEI